MKLISRNTDYGIRAVCYMARKKDSTITVTELVKELGIPRPFMRKILQALSKAGVLESHKGIGGGFRLSKKPQNIYLIDLMKVFQGRLSLNECFFKKEICPNRKSCYLKKKIDSIEKSVYEQLKPITVKSILEGE